MGRPARLMDLAWLDTWSPELAWWLGVFLGDGNVFTRQGKKYAYRVSVAGSLTTVTRWLAVMASDNHPHEFKSSKGTYQGYEDSKQLVEALVACFGYDGPKCFDLRWPTDLPSEFLWHFVRGLWDSDGCVSIAKPRKKDVLPEFKLAYLSVTKSFVGRLCDEIVGHSELPRVVVVEGRSTGFSKDTPNFKVAWGSSSALKLARLLYKDAPEHLRNEDRYLKYLEMERLWAEKVRSCQDCGEEELRLMEGLCRACWYNKRPHITGESLVCQECSQVKKIIAKGLCSACYTRSVRASPGYERKSTGSCACGKPAYRNQQCDSCYSRSRREARGAPAMPQRRNKRSEASGG